MKDTTLAYLAGIMDADGFFTIKRSTYSVRIRKESKNPTYQERAGLKQVQPEAVQLIRKHFGGYYSIQKPSTPNGKPLHAINLTCRKANAFILAIYPFLVLKKPQAKILLALRKNINGGQKGRSKITGRRCVSIAQVHKREGYIATLNQLNDIRAIKEVWRK